MTRVFLSPGGGPVPGRATLAHACSNMECLLEEARLPMVYARDVTARESGGRFAFVVERPRRWKRDRRTVSVMMPGVPLDVLRSGEYLAPRVYIDGSSWYWEYAADLLRRSVLDEGK